MKQIEEVEQSFSEPLATPLLQCGRYRLDGELKVKAPGENGAKKWVSVLCDDVCDDGHTLDGYSCLIKWCLYVVNLGQYLIKDM